VATPAAWPRNRMASVLELVAVVSMNYSSLRRDGGFVRSMLEAMLKNDYIPTRDFHRLPHF
jgi:hypothetical protein